MSSKFSDEFRLKVLDYTCYDTLAPHGVLDILQDIAGKHANSFHMSYEELLSKNQIWVLLRVKYKVLHEIKLYSKIKAITYAHEKGLVDFDRETQILDLNGNVMINAISKWVILDVNKRSIIPAKRIHYPVETCNEKLFEEKFEKLKDFDIQGAWVYQQTIQFSDIDHNGHTNNAKYAQILLNGIRLKENEKIDVFQIDFVNESYLDTNIILYYQKIANSYIAKAVANEKIIFMAKIDLK